MTAYRLQLKFVSNVKKRRKKRKERMEVISVGRGNETTHFPFSSRVSELRDTSVPSMRATAVTVAPAGNPRRNEMRKRIGNAPSGELTPPSARSTSSLACAVSPGPYLQQTKSKIKREN